MMTDIGEADEIIDCCSKNGYKIIDYDDKAYPKRLKEIINPPAVLYVDGELPDIDNLVCIGMVGTRKCANNLHSFKEITDCIIIYYIIFIYYIISRKNSIPKIKNFIKKRNNNLCHSASAII